MDIVFNPPVNEENQYIQRMVGQLRARGYRVHPLDTVFSSRRHFRSIRLVHLNWFENIDDSGFWVALRSFLRKLTVLVAIRLSGKPLVWTMHNRASHERGLAFFSRAITRLLVRWSHRIVIHAWSSGELLAAYGKKASAKAAYIPHPHFIGLYGEPKPHTARGGDTLRLLFAGMVKPYKNLEMLIDVVSAFGDRVQLTIAGKAIDADYERRIASRAAQAGNVTFLPYFVPDDRLAALLADADALVLPYDLASSLNSGTVLLAFSYKKTVICPEIGTIQDLGAQAVHAYPYVYASEQGHRAELHRQIDGVAQLHRRDAGVLRHGGEQLYRHVAAAHDPQRVGELLDDLYRKLIGNNG